jgi:hypothetical protein
MKPGALQRTPGALWVRCGCLTHPEAAGSSSTPKGALLRLSL